MRNRITTALLAVVCLALGMSACSSSHQLVDDSPAAALQAVQGAIDTSGSMHFVDTSSDPTGTTVLTGDIGPTSATETVRGTGDPLEARLVQGLAYVKADEAVLVGTIGLSPDVASAHVQQWVSLDQGDAAYQQVAGSLGIQSETSSYLPTRKVTMRTTVVHMRQVVELSGPLPASALHSTGTVAIYVSPDAPYLPVMGTITSTTATKTGTQTHHETVVFSHWGETVAPAAPPGAVSFDSINA
ncbi:MAG TPA: hypothetical protein VEI83_16610 [Acidimicrobiales bacterium]|nr:hypothetical protein [Acidimicrobiales bacterium]